MNFYNIVVTDCHDLTLSIISYLLSDRRSDANAILIFLLFKFFPSVLKIRVRLGLVGLGKWR